MNVLLLRRGLYNLDAFRHGIETLAPVDYLCSSYYERWRRSATKQLLAAGHLGEHELHDRLRSLRNGGSLPASDPAREPAAASAFVANTGFVREIDAVPRYREGDSVRARNQHPRGHTRLPRYARGRRGRVARVDAAYVFPDANAHGRGESAQHLYSVRFEARELWGDVAEAGTAVYLDLFESYLDPVDAHSEES